MIKERINPSKIQSNPKYVHIKKQVPKTFEAKVDRTERRNRQIHNYCKGRQKPPVCN